MMKILAWILSLWRSWFKPKSVKDFEVAWKEIVSGDHIIITIKDPKTIGIISEHKNTTYQRLDVEDIRTMTLSGYVIRKDTVAGNIEILEFDALKKKNGKMAFVGYLLLKEEIATIKIVEEAKL